MGKRVAVNDEKWLSHRLSNHRGLSTTCRRPRVTARVMLIEFDAIGSCMGPFDDRLRPTRSGGDDMGDI